MCAQFSQEKDYFLMNRKKKNIKIKLAKEINEKYLIGLATDKKLKLKAIEILFIEDAVKNWKKAEMKLGYEFTDSGLGIKVIEKGTGAMPEKGKKVKVHYRGLLEDGTQFDSSIDRGQPFEFPLGMGRVIKGWDEGIAALKVGSKAWLYIPSELGYGKRGAGGAIPPNATLFFYVEVLGTE